MAVGSTLNRTLCDFIERQPLFFVATAASEGRVNLSPKGLRSLKIMDERRIVWLSLWAAATRQPHVSRKAIA